MLGRPDRAEGEGWAGLGEGEVAGPMTGARWQGIPPGPVVRALL